MEVGEIHCPVPHCMWHGQPGGLRRHIETVVRELRKPDQHFYRLQEMNTNQARGDTVQAPVPPADSVTPPTGTPEPKPADYVPTAEEALRFMKHDPVQAADMLKEILEPPNGKTKKKKASDG